MNKTLLVSCLLLTSTQVFSAPLSLEYQGFYQRLKTVHKGNFQRVELAFIVPNQGQCRILKGNIVTENATYPLSYNEEQRLYIPFDPTLKSDRALISMDIEGEAKDCQISMQLRVKNVKQDYKQSALADIETEMNTLLQDLQGFPLKYFADPIAGLSIEFTEPSRITIDGAEVYQGREYHLSHQDIKQLSQIHFSQRPSVISPWVNQAQ